MKRFFNHKFCNHKITSLIDIDMIEHVIVANIKSLYSNSPGGGGTCKLVKLLSYLVSISILGLVLL